MMERAPPNDFAGSSGSRDGVGAIRRTSGLRVSILALVPVREVARGFDFGSWPPSELDQSRTGAARAWINHARAASTVVFEREVARSMICHSPVKLTICGDELLSVEIHTGEFANFCELKPGHDRHRVVRRNPEGAATGVAIRRLEGEIIVAAPWRRRIG